jgi:hypothetical protein
MILNDDLGKAAIYPGDKKDQDIMTGFINNLQKFYDPEKIKTLQLSPMQVTAVQVLHLMHSNLIFL